MALGYLITLRAFYETFGISVPTLLDSVRSRMSIERGNQRLFAWSRTLIEQAGASISVSGREHVAPGGSFVVMSNHQSHYDVPVLFQSFPGTMRMVAKTELFRIPLFGPAMTAAGFIEIDRSNRERAIESLRLARARLEQGVSVWIAPEGTRSRTGTLGPFKKGGFLLAMETGLSVIPVGIAGSRDILEADALEVHQGGRVHVALRAPIAPPAMGAGTAARDQFMAEVRASIEAGIAEGQRRLLAAQGGAR